jgi:hypothetical protein
MTMYPINLHIPSEKDWRSYPWDFDTESAYKTFHGKSLAEARAVFKSNAFYYLEELTHMPSRCFQYYLNAYLDYILSDESRGESGGASSLFYTVEARIQEFADYEELRQRTCESLTQIALRQEEWYDASEDIYGSFAEKASILIQRMNALSKKDTKSKRSKPRSGDSQ